MKNRKNTSGKKIKMAWDDRIFSIITAAIILFLTIACLVPFLYLLAVSLSGPTPVMRGEVFLIPKTLPQRFIEILLKTGR